MSDDSQPFELLDRDYDTSVPLMGGHDAWEPTLVDRLLSVPTAIADWTALNLMERLFLSGDVPNLAQAGTKLDRMQAYYADADLLAHPERFYEPPTTLPPIEVERLSLLDDGERLELRFDSPHDAFDPAVGESYRQHRENLACTARLWRHRLGRDRPMVIALHCWCGGRLWHEERIFAAERLYREGFDVLIVTLPFHGTRTPQAALFSGQMFPSPHLDQTNEAFRHAVRDVRVLVAWLRRGGHSGPMGLIGISLGGYTSALLASLDDGFDFVVPIIAPASFADLLWWHGARRPSRSRFEAAGVDLERLRAIWALHSPLSFTLRVPRDRALIVAAAGDEIVRPAQVLSLWRHWGRPELRWFAGSHLGHARWFTGGWFHRRQRLDFMGQLLDWLHALRFEAD